ncbi:uridine phosphorylase 1-like isoform X1 [Ostrinia nubilalis]|uniref:uridine phosphorylase 1-like isoform X1 n=2 Tax=Ostrinia nubilalis TaxID=29057 RepID=UPI0030824659
MSCDCDYILKKEDVETQHYSNCSSLAGGAAKLRNPDGTLTLNNKHLKSLDSDYLYHLGIDTGSYDLSMFEDVKFVCLGGKKHRMHEFAKYMAGVLGLETGEKLVNLTKHSKRFAMYKVGPVLSVNHGIGVPSMTTVLQEVIKLMYYAKAKDPIFIRLGTSGGLNVPAGSVVISSCGLSGTMEKSYDLPILGQVRRMPSILDARLSQEILQVAKGIKEFNTYIGATMGADDFYRGQGRLDGPFCDYTEENKMAFLRKLAGLDVKNIEMEATAFAAFTSQAGVRGAIICVTFLDRLHGDQVLTPPETLAKWEERPMAILGKLITKYCDKKA